MTNPIITPPIVPAKTANQILELRPNKLITKYAKIIKIIAAEKVPPRRAPLILAVDVLLARYFTIRIPDIEHSYYYI